MIHGAAPPSGIIFPPTSNLTLRLTHRKLSKSAFVRDQRRTGGLCVYVPCAVHIALFVRQHWIPTLTVCSVTHAGKFSFLTWSQGPYSHLLQHIFMLMNTLADSLSNLSLIWVTLQHKPTLK